MIQIVRYPTDVDWARCYWLAAGTEGKQGGAVPDRPWRERILNAGHSPIRTLMFTVRITDAPYWVVMHLARHKVGVEHYVSSQRNDRQAAYDRNAARQDAPVTYTFDINADALINVSHRRLCGKAAKETHELWAQVVEQIVKACPEFKSVLVPMCQYRGGVCHEMKGCGLCSPLGGSY